MTTTIDFVGNPLRVGDDVAVESTYYKGLERGVVSAVSRSGKTVDVECDRASGTKYTIYNRQVAKVVRVVPIETVADDG